jgi:hypothetical protein
MKSHWNLMSIILVAGAMVLPVIPAFGMPQTETQRRNQTQNEWRNIATVSGAAALLGVLKKDKTLTFAGAAGTLYALYRYNEDSKSKDRLAKAKAAYFSRDQFYRDGVRYNRRTVSKNGQNYYQFYRAPRSQQDWKEQGLHDNRNNEHSNRNHDKHRWSDTDGENGRGRGKGKRKDKGEGDGEDNNSNSQGHGHGHGHGG